jgi:hypothetical protein
MGATEAVLQARMREVMESHHDENCFLFNLGEMAQRRQVQAREMLQNGLVAAVDGTDAMAPLAHMSTSTYVAAVEIITRLTRTKPEIWLTETSTQYVRTEEVAEADFDLSRLSQELDAVRDAGSWVTCFREYAERDVAIRSSYPFIILDGPILTQNLLTQRRGIELYERLFVDPKRIWLGVIKDIAATPTLMRWAGYCLHHGEGFVVETTRRLVESRFASAGKRARMPHWLEALPDDIVRVVYRPGEKAFGFECRRTDLELVIAVLMEDASPTLHHELPLLLEVVDAHLRGGFRASAVRDAVISRLQQHNWEMGINAMNERELR